MTLAQTPCKFTLESESDLTSFKPQRILNPPAKIDYIFLILI